MHELVAILIIGAIGMGVSYGFMFLLKVKPSKETSADAWIEGYIIGQQIDRLFGDD